MKWNFSCFGVKTDYEIALLVTDGVMTSRLVGATLTGEQMSEASRGGLILLRRATCYSTVIRPSDRQACNCDFDKQNFKLEEHRNI
jgi:hypothetical protein